MAERWKVTSGERTMILDWNRPLPKAVLLVRRLSGMSGPEAWEFVKKLRSEELDCDEYFDASEPCLVCDGTRSFEVGKKLGHGLVAVHENTLYEKSELEGKLFQAEEALRVVTAHRDQLHEELGKERRVRDENAPVLLEGIQADDGMVSLQNLSDRRVGITFNPAWPHAIARPGETIVIKFAPRKKPDDEAGKPEPPKAQ
jgi:hypothetical protein